MKDRLEPGTPTGVGPAPGTIRRVLVPLDGSALAECAIPHAVTIARAFAARVVLLRVVGAAAPGAREGVSTATRWRLERLEAERYLADRVETMRRAGVTVEGRTAVGRASEQILSTAGSAAMDLILLSSHGAGGPTEFPLSGTASKVLGSAACSALVVPAGEQDARGPGYTRILVPVDGSRRSDWNVAVAVRIGMQSAAEVVLMHVVQAPELFGEPGPESELRRLAGRLVELNAQAAREHLQGLVRALSAGGLRVRERIEPGSNVVHAIEGAAREEGASLVVIGAHGHAAATGRAYGAVSGALLTCGTLPTLVLQDLPRRPPPVTPATDVPAAHPAPAGPR